MRTVAAAFVNNFLVYVLTFTIFRNAKWIDMRLLSCRPEILSRHRARGGPGRGWQERRFASYRQLCGSVHVSLPLPSAVLLHQRGAGLADHRSPPARRTVKDIVEGPPRQLLEAVAEDVAGAILRDFRPVRSVSVRLVKPHVAVPGVLDSLGV